MANRLETPNVTTLATVKQFLGITDTSQDTAIELYLPIVTQDILKITNQMWIIERVCAVDGFDITNISTRNLVRGQVVSADIQTTIDTIDDTNSSITVADSLATDPEANILINVTPYPLRLTASKMVAYQIKKNSFDSNALLQGEVQSENIGTYSYTLGDGEGGSSQGYPNAIIKELMKYTKPRFY